MSMSIDRAEIYDFMDYAEEGEVYDLPAHCIKDDQEDLQELAQQEYERLWDEADYAGITGGELLRLIRKEHRRFLRRLLWENLKDLFRGFF